MDLSSQPPAPRDQKSYLLALSLFWSIGYTIAIPAIVLGIGGVQLDRTMHSSPLFTLLGFTLALAVSGWAVYRMIRKILDEEKREEKSLQEH